MIHFCERKFGKLLFPRSERWKRQQKIRIVFLVLLIEIAIAGAIVLIAMLNDTKWK
jgi:hypothetical protein